MGALSLHLLHLSAWVQQRAPAAGVPKGMGVGGGGGAGGGEMWVHLITPGPLDGSGQGSDRDSFSTSCLHRFLKSNQKCLFRNFRAKEHRTFKKSVFDQNLTTCRFAALKPPKTRKESRGKSRKVEGSRGKSRKVEGSRGARETLGKMGLSVTDFLIFLLEKRVNPREEALQKGGFCPIIADFSRGRLGKNRQHTDKVEESRGKSRKVQGSQKQLRGSNFKSNRSLEPKVVPKHSILSFGAPGTPHHLWRVLWMGAARVPTAGHGTSCKHVIVHQIYALRLLLKRIFAHRMFQYFCKGFCQRFRAKI